MAPGESALRNLDSIITASTELIREAFEAGRNAGRAEADDLRAKMAALISVDVATPLPLRATTMVVSSGDRATQGSVKPTIAKLIAESAAGMTPGEIIEVTGFKPNSVRGTLWTLMHDGAIVKREGRWHSAPPSDL